LVAFLSLVSVAGQLFARNYKYVSSFVVLGVVTAYFTKSMSLILLVPLVVVNLLVSANYIKEGLENKKEQTLDEMKAELEEKQAELEEKQAELEETSDNEKLKEEVKKIEKHVEDLENKIVLKESEEEESEESEEEEDVMTEGSEEVVDLQKIMKKMEPTGKHSNMKKSKVSSLKPKEENIMETEEEMVMEQMKNRKKRDGFRPKKRLVHRGKAKYLNPEKDTDEAVGETIDYASTLEQAYGNLQKMMGKGGMKGLTQETSKLVNQQKELMDSLKSMAPALNDAKKTLSGFNIPNMGDMKKMLSSIQQ
jgi:uncharacterized membrane-anchored protein YhcB (DUF1043 family)